MVKNILKGFFFILLTGWLQTQAQNVNLDSIPSASLADPSGKAPVIRKPHVSVMTGMDFTSSSGYGSGFSTYFFPSVSYPVSSKLQISGGIGIVNTSLNGYRPYFSLENGNTFNGNITNALVYVSGQYMLNDRITVSGTAYKQFTLNSNIPGFSATSGNGPSGMLMNIGYKINDYLHIEAGFGYSKGYSPYFDGYRSSPLFYGPGFIR